MNSNEHQPEGKQSEEKIQSKERIVTLDFVAKGTTCESCAELIKKQALKVDGVKKAEFDYASETGQVTFDKTKTNINTIIHKIEEKGYICSLLEKQIKNRSKNVFGWMFGIIGIIVAGYFLLNIISRIELPALSQNMSYGLLFVIGLLTGFHCVAMCGGFVVSYTARHAQEGTKTYSSHLLYGLGKTISYTLIGAVFGLLGAIIAFTPLMRGVAGILAGLFLLFFGLKMLNIFPILRKVQLRTPVFINKFVNKLVNKESRKRSSKHSSPLMIGLLNGLMIACGPLQALYIMAAGTGSMLEGAKLLFVFALGTLPVMFGFGYLTSYISSKMTHKILKVSGIVVILLGLIMLNRGLALTGSGYDFNSILQNSIIQNNDLNIYSVEKNVEKGLAKDGLSGTASSNIALLNNGKQEIRMQVTRYGWKPDKFILRKGIPVRWVIEGKEITNCNSAIQVPKLGLNFAIQQGEQVIEFTPTEEGIISWSCWMGMLQGTFIVKNEIDFNNINNNINNGENIDKDIQNEFNSIPQRSGGSCGAAGGGCGCGMR